MAIPSILLKAVASQIPWKDVLSAAPDVLKSAKEMLASSKKQADAPVVAPTDDARTQLAALAERTHQGELAQAEQAKLIAALAAQMEAMTVQVQANAVRARRVLWLAGASAALSLASLVLVAVQA